MGWTLGSRQFDMHLAKEVPVLIRDNVAAAAQALCAHVQLDFERAKRDMLFAIHPGGPKILDHSRDALGLEERQVAHARSVFRALGNMSSATVPHILLSLLKDEDVRRGTRILAMGFGPGLTASGLLLEKC